jgi:uncharacterized protein YggU (UPF0235/DUF167 family)
MPERTIKAKVIAGAKTEGVEELAEGQFKVRVRPKAEKGRANARVLELLADHFDVAKSKVTLLSGAAYKEKLVRIFFEE